MSAAISMIGVDDFIAGRSRRKLKSVARTRTPTDDEKRFTALWRHAEKAAQKYLRAQWKRRAADHDDVIADAALKFDEKIALHESKSKSDAANWLVRAVELRMRQLDRDEKNHTRILKDGMDTPTREKPLPRGYSKLPSGRLFRAHSMSTPKHPVIASRGEPGAGTYELITPDLANAIAALEFLVHLHYELLGSPNFLQIDVVSKRRIEAAYEAAFRHRPEDAEDVSATKALLAALESAHERELIREDEDDARHVRGEGNWRPWLPQWISDSDLEALYSSTGLNPGGRSKSLKSIDAAVLAFMNRRRAKLGKPKWRSLESVGIPTIARKNSRPRSTGV